MNECEQTNLLNAYHDGELSPAAAARLEQHIAACPRCEASLRQLVQLSGLLGRHVPAAMPPGAMRRLHRKVDAASALPIRHMAEVLAAVAATILVVCSIAMGRIGRTAQSADVLPVWEAQAVASQPAEGSAVGADEQLASWMAADLSWKDEQ